MTLGAVIVNKVIMKSKLRNICKRLTEHGHKMNFSMFCADVVLGKTFCIFQHNFTYEKIQRL